MTLTTSTMSLTYREFPSGSAVPGTGPSTIPVGPSGNLILDAPTILNWDFRFWVVAGQVFDKTNPLTDPVPVGQSAFDATAWYLYDPVSPPPSTSPTPAIKVWAFSLDQDQVLVASPLASVTGGTQVDANDVTPSGQLASVLTANDLMSGAGLFSSWLPIFGATSSGKVLTVPANVSAAAIAFYAIPSPDPCQELRDELTADLEITPGDFPNSRFPPGWQNLIATARKNLAACEAKYGEKVS